MGHGKEVWFDNKINGTPAELWELARTLDDPPPLGLVWGEDEEPFVPSTHIFVRRYESRGTIGIQNEVTQARGQHVSGEIVMSAVSIPTGGQWLKVTHRQGDRDLAERMWLLLRAELIEKGFIQEAKPGQEEGDQSQRSAAKKAISSGMRLETGRKILDLLEKRKKWLTNRSPRDFTPGCENVGIEPETVASHYPQLQAHWHDKEYPGTDVFEDILRQHPSLKPNERITR